MGKEALDFSFIWNRCCQQIITEMEIKSTWENIYIPVIFAHRYCMSSKAKQEIGEQKKNILHIYVVM